MNNLHRKKKREIVRKKEKKRGKEKKREKREKKKDAGQTKPLRKTVAKQLSESSSKFYRFSFSLRWTNNNNNKLASRN